jgi:hypothetical protein
MQRSRKIALMSASLAVFATAGAALLYSGLRRGALADASPSAELLSEVPAGAPTLIYLDFAAVRASGFYQHRPDRGPITLPDRDYADFVRSTGFDFEKDLDRVVIASWPAGLSQGRDKEGQDKTVVVADGRFDREKIREYALHKGKLDHQQGREVFLFSSGTPANWNSMIFLEDHRVAMVQGPSIAPLLEHHEENPAADSARERAARVAGAAAFAITRVPPIPDQPPSGGAPSAQLMSLARSVQWVTLAARPEGDDLRVSLEGECDNGTDARQLQSALELLRMLGLAGLDSPKSRQSMDPATLAVLQTALKSADITESGERVRILIELTPDILKLSGPRKAQQ